MFDRFCASESGHKPKMCAAYGGNLRFVALWRKRTYYPTRARVRNDQSWYKVAMTRTTFPLFWRQGKKHLTGLEQS